MSPVAWVLPSRTHISDVAMLGHLWTSCHDSLILGCCGVMEPLLSPHCLAAVYLCPSVTPRTPSTVLGEIPREWPPHCWGDVDAMWQQGLGVDPEAPES